MVFADTSLANLHAYWVYEAKMGFLMTVSASKRGAEDLLDAGIFEQLSMCAFISVPPMREEIIGKPHSSYPVEQSLTV